MYYLNNTPSSFVFDDNNEFNYRNIKQLGILFLHKKLLLCSYIFRYEIIPTIQLNYLNKSI